MILPESKGISLPKWIANQQMIVDDLSYLHRASYQTVITALALLSVQSTEDEIVQGMKAIADSGLNVSVTAGAGISYTGRYFDSSSTFVFVAGAGEIFIAVLPIDTSITFDTGVGQGNDRIDTVQVRPIRSTWSTESRRFKDPVTTLVTSANITTKIAYEAEVQIVKGTPAATPSAPARTAGWIKIAEVSVADGQSSIAQSDIVDYTQSDTWTTEVGDTLPGIAVGAVYKSNDFTPGAVNRDVVYVIDCTNGDVTVGSLPSASTHEGITLTFRKIDTSTNVVDGLSSGYPLRSQQDSASFWSDGTSWNWVNGIIRDAAQTVTDSGVTLTASSPTILYLSTGASDRTVDLPVGSTLRAGQQFRVVKIDAGSGRGVISRQSTDVIDGVTDIYIDSQYDHAILEWTGSSYTVMSYKDHGTVGGGDDANPTWYFERYANGVAELRGRVAWSNGPTRNYNFTFVGEVPVVANIDNNDQSNRIGASSLTGFNVVDSTGSDVHTIVRGRWRT